MMLPESESGLRRRRVFSTLLIRRPGRLAALLLALFLAQGSVALVHMSATADETHYLGMGWYLLQEADWSLADALLHPPLSYYLHGLPLFLLDLDTNLFANEDMLERGRLLMAAYPDDRVLLLSRVPILLLGVFLGWILYRWATASYGARGGLLALFLYTFSPVLITNAVWITPDFCLAFFTVLCLYYLWRYQDSESPVFLVVAGGALGLALLSKYSAVLLVIALLIQTVAEFFYRRVLSGDPGRSALSLSGLATVLLVALVVVNAGYGFTQTFQFLEQQDFKSALFQGVYRLELMEGIPIPLPRPYITGMDWQYTVVENGFNYYLLGEASQTGWYHYFVVAFFLKSPMSFVVLFCIATWVSFRRGLHATQLLILVPMLLFPFYFSVFKVSRGIRYVLPSIPLLILWTARLAGWEPARAARLWRWALGILLGACALASFRVAPHYPAFINEAAGGPAAGHRYLFESDYDWGQELKGLATYMRENQIESVKLGYFGTADPGHYGVRYQRLPCQPDSRASGWIAVSSTALQTWGCYDWLNHHSPETRVGHTIFVFRVP